MLSRDSLTDVVDVEFHVDNLMTVKQQCIYFVFPYNSRAWVSCCLDVVRVTYIFKNIDRMMSSIRNVLNIIDMTICDAVAGTFRRSGMHGNAAAMVRESSVRTI